MGRQTFQADGVVIARKGGGRCQEGVGNHQEELHDFCIFVSSEKESLTESEVDSSCWTNPEATPVYIAPLGQRIQV